MDAILLKDQTVFPEKEILQAALKESFAAYEELCTLFSDLGIIPEWNYYKDGYVWLCKMMFKKKNMGWLAVYDAAFAITFYFTAKHLEAIAALNISEQIKIDFAQAKSIGKLLPMTIRICGKILPKDIATLLRFKKEWK